MIPVPRQMEFNDWACAMLDSVKGLRTFPAPNGTDNWRQWAADILNDPLFIGKQVLGYNNCDRWQEWADSLVHAMENDV